MPYINHIFQIVHVQIWDNYVSMYAAYTHQPLQYLFLIWTYCNQQCDREHWYTYPLHYWDIPLNKYITWHICAPLHCCCSLNINHILLYIWLKTTTNCNSYVPCYWHICAKRNKPLICHIRKLVLVHILDNCQYMSHINSLQSIVSPHSLVCIHFTLLAFVPDQMWLPHHKCMSHCTKNVFYILTLHLCI